MGATFLSAAGVKYPGTGTGYDMKIRILIRCTPKAVGFFG